MKDAEEVLKLFRTCAYGRRVQVEEGVIIRFQDMGHLLGSSAIEIWLKEGDVEKKIVFSGDIGNTDQPIIKDPQPVEEADYVVIESTYGNRSHGPRPAYVESLSGILQETFDRGGNVVIPSFAVGRTQEMLYFLREIKQKGLVKGHDGFPVYVDSPLANEATRVFLQCSSENFDPEMKELVRQGINPIWFEGLRISVTAEDSKAINFDTEPKVILSASGMCDAGRIRHHLKHNLWREECTILFVGYQSVGTLGRALCDGADQVKLFDEKIAVEAKICQLPGISGHADREGLLRWLQAYKEKPAHVFVNHGDHESCEDFRSLIAIEYGYEATAPYSGAVFDLAEGRFLAEPEGVRIRREEKENPSKQAVEKKAGQPEAAQTKKEAKQSHDRKSSMAYNRLLRAIEKLTEVAEKNRNRSEKDLKKLTKQIENLCKQWRR